MHRTGPSILSVLLGTVMLVAATPAIGMNSAAAQGGTPEAIPAGEPSCTADLGIVRSTKTCVNVVHSAQNTPNVDALFNGEPVVSGVGYGTASGFVSIPAGTYDVPIVPSGQGSETALVGITGVELVAGRAYEIALLGSRDAIEAKIIDVDVYAIEGTSQAGSTRIRLVNASGDFVLANLDLIGGDIANRVFRGVDIAQASEYAVVAAGRYQARLTGSAGGEETLYSSTFTVDLQRDTVSSIYIIGARSGDTITILPVATQASRLPAPASPEASPPA